MDNIEKGTTPGSSAAAMPERDIGLYELVAGIGRRWRMIASFVVIAAFIAIVVLVSTKSRYASEVRILFGDTESEILRTDRTTGRNPIDKDLVLSQVHVLRSRDLMDQVIKDLNLPQYLEFDSISNGLGLKSRLAIWLGFAEDPRLMTPEQRAWKSLNTRLTVYAIPNSRVISAEVWSHNPELAAAVANSLAQAYLQSSKASKSQSNRQAMEWLAKRVRDLQAQVQTAEARVETFRAQAGLLQGTTTTLNAQELSEINTQITLASASRSQAEARARQIRILLKNGGDLNASNEILQSPLIGRLREQQVTLRRLVADLSSKYLPSHPRMARLRAEIGDLSRQVRAEMKKIVAGLEGETRVAAAREASLKASLDRVKVTTGQANSQQVRLKALVRDAAATSQLLETYMGRFREASARADIETQSPNARIISRAYVSNTPSFPKKGPILILLTLGALIFGVVVAFLLEIFAISPSGAIAPSGSISTDGERQMLRDRKLLPEHVFKAKEKTDKVPLVAELPGISDRAHKHVERELETLVSNNNNYRRGIEGLQKFVSEASVADRGTKILAASAIPSFDRSMAIAALARCLSAEGNSVLLIDADFLMQNLSSAFHLTAFQGLADLITGQAPFSDVVIQDVHSTIHIVPVGSQANFNNDDDAEMRLDVVVDAFAHAYDYVIIDSGMAHVGSAMWSLAHSSDVNIAFLPHKESADSSRENLVEQMVDVSSGAIGLVTTGKPTAIDALKSMKFARRAAAA